MRALPGWSMAPVIPKPALPAQCCKSLTIRASTIAWKSRQGCWQTNAQRSCRSSFVKKDNRHPVDRQQVFTSLSLVFKEDSEIPAEYASHFLLAAHTN